MFSIGRMCVKIAGRDAGLKCVVVDILDDTFVVIDGQTRRRKCNIKHLEPLVEVVKIKKNAPHKEVVDEFKKLKIEVKETKPREPSKKPVKLKKKKEKPAGTLEETVGVKKETDTTKKKATSPKETEKKGEAKKSKAKKTVKKDK